MNKNKKNGFTLIELIAVIAILGILSIIAIPKLMDTFSDRKERLYETTIKELQRFAGMYLNDNPNLYVDLEEDGYIDIQINTLCNNKYLNCPVSDPRDNSEISGFVRITNENNNYIYEFIKENTNESDN